MNKYLEVFWEAYEDVGCFVVAIVLFCVLMVGLMLGYTLWQ